MQSYIFQPSIYSKNFIATDGEKLNRHPALSLQLQNGSGTWGFHLSASVRKNVQL